VQPASSSRTAAAAIDNNAVLFIFASSSSKIWYCFPETKIYSQKAAPNPKGGFKDKGYVLYISEPDL
jgi:hypothetical protein